MGVSAASGTRVSDLCLCAFTLRFPLPKLDSSGGMDVIAGVLLQPS
jgi:hypothetical protein